MIAVTSEWGPFVDNGHCRMDFVKTNPPFPQEHKLKGRVSPGLFFAKTLNFDACPKTAGSVPGVGKRRKMVGAAGFEPATPTHTVLSWLFIERPYFLPSSLILGESACINYASAMLPHQP